MAGFSNIVISYSKSKPHSKMFLPIMTSKFSVTFLSIILALLTLTRFASSHKAKMFTFYLCWESTGDTEHHFLTLAS